jgi:hypothetical protein
MRPVELQQIALELIYVAGKYLVENGSFPPVAHAFSPNPEKPDAAIAFSEMPEKREARLRLMQVLVELCRREGFDGIALIADSFIATGRGPVNQFRGPVKDIPGRREALILVGFVEGYNLMVTQYYRRKIKGVVLEEATGMESGIGPAGIHKGGIYDPLLELFEPMASC